MQQAFVDNARGSDDVTLVGPAILQFRGVEKLLIELLPGPEAGIYNLYVRMRLVAGELDHALGEIGDTHGFAHVENHDLAAIGLAPQCMRGSVENEPHR